MPNTTVVWLIIGAVLCLTEMFFPTAFVALMMGISAFFVALLSGAVLGQLWLQIVVWLLVSTALVLLCRPFLKPRRRKSKIQDAVIAQTLTEIPAGKSGRVLYEGNSWRARCDDDISIAAHEQVYVVRREGTTLVVMPEFRH